MKHHKLITLVSAVLIALSTIIVNPAPVTAHGNGGPPWSTIERGWLTRQQSSIKHYIPVCLETSVYGPTWNPTAHPNHARMVAAFNTWNLGGRLLYFASNTPCATWRAGGGPFLSIKKLNQSQLGFTAGASVLCNELWGIFCSKEVSITYDSAPAYPWYVGTGVPPNNTYDFWSVMVHEIGHTMRCDGESTNPLDAMFGSLDHDGDWQRTLTADDRECYTHYY